MCNNRTKKNQRKGISVLGLLKMFPDDATAEKWFEKIRWGDKKTCPYCGSDSISENNGKSNANPYRCKDCRSFFNVKIGTVMQSTRLGYQKWVFGIYLLSTNLKGVSSMKVHRDLGITQKTAWMLCHKIREGFGNNLPKLEGEIEIDETYIGGKERNKHADKKLKAGRGAVGKQPVMGMRERGGKVKAMPIADTTIKTTHGLVRENIERGSRLYTDDARHWTGGVNGYAHESVNHSAKEYVNGQAHTNGIESFWALLKRGYHGTHHHISEKHLHRYVSEFAGRHNVRHIETIKQMVRLVLGFEGKKMPYKRLIKFS